MQAVKEKSGELAWEITPHLGHLEGRMRHELADFRALWRSWRQELVSVEPFRREWETALQRFLIDSGLPVVSLAEAYKTVLGEELPDSFDKGLEGAVHVTACRVRFRLHQALSQSSRRRQEMDVALVALEEGQRMSAMFAMEVELIKLLPPPSRFGALRECYDGLCHVKGLVQTALSALQAAPLWKAKEQWRKNPLELEVLVERWGQVLAQKQRKTMLRGILF